jgi:hypothetical protein
MSSVYCRFTFEVKKLETEPTLVSVPREFPVGATSPLGNGLSRVAAEVR